MSSISPCAPGLVGPRIMRQTWADLTFLHWPVDPVRIAPMMPAGTRPDVLDGVTYVGLIPFVMRRAGFGRGPAIPWLGDFLETNVRLYSIDDQGRRGVVFLSLESNRLAVALGARLAFATPYTWARMSLHRDGDLLRYRTHRRWPGPRRAGGEIVVRRGAAIDEPDESSIFVSARFGLHTEHVGRTWWVPNAHPPWRLHEGELLELSDDLVAVAGLPGVVDDPPASVLITDPVRTSFGLPQLLKGAR